MSRYQIVDDIINEIKSLTDEENDIQLEADVDILPSLNRAQEKAYQLLSRTHQDPIRNYTEQAVTTREFSLPENIWEDKIIRLEWFRDGYRPVPCDRVDLQLLAKYDTLGQVTPTPVVYAIVGRTVRLNGTPDGTHSLRIWSLREVDSLVMSYGRITALDVASNTVYLSDVDTSWSPSELTSYVNVIDGQTGLIKGSLQVKSYNEVDTLSFKTSPDRTKVFNRTISTGLSGLGIEADDYICFVKGTCVLQFFDAVHTFIVQMTTAEMKRKLGLAYDVDQQLVQDFEEDLRRTYQGRDRVLRVQNNNPNWITSGRRRFVRGSGF